MPNVESMAQVVGRRTLDQKVPGSNVAVYLNNMNYIIV